MTTPWPQQDHATLARELGAARAAAEPEALARLAELLGVVFRLRDEGGCPWDRKQTLASMVPNLQEEAAEVADAVATGGDAHVAEELGDTLMNVFLMARIGADEGRFGLEAVAAGIAEKLVRRHAHVFGDVTAEDAEAALASWGRAKRAEGRTSASRLDGVPAGLPALLAAHQLGQRAAATGFDWPDVEGALGKLHEELGELDQARAGDDPSAVEDELGDVLFSVVNVARKLDVDPDRALRRTLAKFRRRFAAVEDALGDDLETAGLGAMEAAWRAATRAERGPSA